MTIDEAIEIIKKYRAKGGSNKEHVKQNNEAMDMAIDALRLGRYKEKPPCKYCDKATEMRSRIAVYTPWPDDPRLSVITYHTCKFKYCPLCGKQISA